MNEALEDTDRPRRRLGFAQGFLAQGLVERRTHFRYPMALVWLLFIIFPLANAIGTNGPVVRHALTIFGAAMFIAAYVALVVRGRRDEAQRSPITGLLFGVLLSIATALTTSEQPGWGFLFTYCAATAAFVAPASLAFYAVAVCTVLAAGTSAIAGATGATVLGFGASCAGIGLLMLVMRDLRIRNAELCRARAELAQLAVAQERERFARDLHDLLGHSLSVITLKTELAGKLLPARPDQAAREVAEVEEVARKALREVRHAVSGDHQPTLDGELEGARMALLAAGIDASVQRPSVTLAPSVEAVLAWAVREGATNVIRHSRATHVTMRVTAGLGEAEVEVLDDGVGGVAVSGNGNGAVGGDGDGHGLDQGRGLAAGHGLDPGHGLAGLMARASVLHGRVEAGALPGGGFRLAVRVPVSAGGAGAT